jgi:hypothetical protein
MNKKHFAFTHKAKPRHTLAGKVPIESLKTIQKVHAQECMGRRGEAQLELCIRCSQKPTHLPGSLRPLAAPAAPSSAAAP